MCEDTTCAVCGKNFSSCRHYRKEHIPNGNRALCGQRNVVLLPEDWRDLALDPDDMCLTCAKKAKIDLPDNLLVGLQTTIKFDYIPDRVELWLGQSPDFFAWVVPENDQWARIGIAAKNNVNKYFRKFVKNRIGKSVKQKNKISGLMRFGVMKKSVSDRVILVGDAACQVKPFSGGGLVYGLIGSKIAADTCIKAIENNKYDHSFLKENYNDIWKKKLFWPIVKGLLLNKISNNISESVLDFGIRSCNIIKPFLENWDMDLLD